MLRKIQLRFKNNFYDLFFSKFNFRHRHQCSLDFRQQQPHLQLVWQRLGSLKMDGLIVQSIRSRVRQQHCRQQQQHLFCRQPQHLPLDP